VTQRFLPAPDLRPLSVAITERWQRLQNSNVALAEFHRALREGDLVAWLYQEGKELRAIGRSYWRRARLEFDRELVLTIMLGDAPQPGRFYVSAVPHPDVSPEPPLAQRKSRAGSGLRLLSDLQIEQAQGYYGGLLDKDPQRWRRQETAARHITVTFLKLPEESWQTIESQIVVPVLIERGLKKPRKPRSLKKRSGKKINAKK
jgi:hypothetical protein